MMMGKWLAVNLSDMRAGRITIQVWHEPLPWFDQTVLHPVIRSQQRQVLKLEMVMVMGRMDKEGGIAGR